MIRHDCPQYSPEWWEVRRGVPTASNFSRIVTPANGEFSSQAEAYAADLVAELYDTDYGVPKNEYETAAMKNGTIMEPEARNYLAFRLDAEIDQVGFCKRDADDFGCSPDGLIGDDGALEIKCPTPGVMVRWLIDGVLPTEHRPQVHGHLLVTGRAYCYFLAYRPGFPKLLVKVEPDAYTEKLAGHLATFWCMYQEMRNKIEPLVGEAIAEKTRRIGPLTGPLTALVPPSDDFQPF